MEACPKLQYKRGCHYISESSKSTVISIGQTLNIPNGKSDSGSKKPSSKNSGTTKSVYTVKSGDSLWLIASDFKMSVQELKKLNGLTSDLIRAGQKLQVTGKVSSSTDQKKNRSWQQLKQQQKAVIIFRDV